MKPDPRFIPSGDEFPEPWEIPERTDDCKDGLAAARSGIYAVLAVGACTLIGFGAFLAQRALA